MDENAHRNNTEPESPASEAAQLLKLLELQAAARRQRGGVASGVFQGNGFRYGSLVAIVVFTLGAVVMMDWFVSQLKRPDHPGDTVSSVVAGKSGMADDNSR